MFQYRLLTSTLFGVALFLLAGTAHARPDPAPGQGFCDEGRYLSLQLDTILPNYHVAYNCLGGFEGVRERRDVFRLYYRFSAGLNVQPNYGGDWMIGVLPKVAMPFAWRWSGAEFYIYPGLGLHTGISFPEEGGVNGGMDMSLTAGTGVRVFTSDTWSFFVEANTTVWALRTIVGMFLGGLSTVSYGLNVGFELP